MIKKLLLLLKLSNCPKPAKDSVKIKEVKIKKIISIKIILNSFFEVNTGVVRTTSNFATKNIETYNDFTAAAELNPVKAGPFRDQALAVKREADAIVNYIQELKYKLVLAVDKSATSDQLAPFQSSVRADLGDGLLPPKAKAAVYVPEVSKPFLAVFKSFNSVQFVPL